MFIFTTMMQLMMTGMMMSLTFVIMQRQKYLPMVTKRVAMALISNDKSSNLFHKTDDGGVDYVAENYDDIEENEGKGT